MAVPPCQKPARPELLENCAFGPASSSSRVGILANVSNPMLTATLPQLRSVAEALRVTIDVFEVRSSGDGCSVHLSASAVLPIETVNSRALASVARCCRSPHRIDDWARLANIGGLDAVKYLDDDPARCPSGGTASGWTISATPGGFGMKITSYESAALNIPEDDPLANMPEEVGRTRPVVILRLRTDAGIEGIGVTLWGGRLSGSLRAAVDDLAAQTIGEDPRRIENIIARLRGAAGSSGGPGGIFTLALAAIDIALWDIMGQAAEQPLWKLLGGHRDRVATYASGSLRRGLTHDQAQHAARVLVEKGFVEM